MIRLLLPVIAASGCVVGTVSAVNAIAALTSPVPRIGDIVSFEPGMARSGTEKAGGESARLIVQRQDQFGCVLDTGVLRQSGGSLVVEGQVIGTAGSFRVHWAGLETSAGAGNCGGDADLILDGRELDVLALHAGGYGSGIKRPPIVVDETGI